MRGKVLSVFLAVALVLSLLTPIPAQAASSNATAKKYLTKVLDATHKMEIVLKKGYKFPKASTFRAGSFKGVSTFDYDDDDDWDYDDDYDDDDDWDYDDDDWDDDWDDDDDYDYDDDYDDDDYDNDDDTDETYKSLVKEYAKYIGVSSDDVYDALDDNDMDLSNFALTVSDSYTSMCFAVLCYNEKTGISDKMSNYGAKADKAYSKSRKTKGIKNYYKAVYNYVNIFANINATKYKQNPKKFISAANKAYNKAKKLKKKA